MTGELAWKPRCAVIICVNVWARSTLEISTTPEGVKPNCGPGWPIVGVPGGADRRRQAVGAGARKAGEVRERGRREKARRPARARPVDVGPLAVLRDADVGRA